ncbi:MAG: hypothetical protein H6Q60_855 [Oscillospiraceae bacterium]|nr:hypothetical protein [Oscillospiraceae bacterium]
MKRNNLGARITAAVLALLLALPQAALASDALGWDMLQHTITIGQDTTITDTNFWSDTYSTLRSEHYLSYQPTGGVTGLVSFGSGVYSKATLTTMARSLEAQGYRVLCGINGDYYDSTGVPLGMVVTDGVLRSSSSYYYAVGFNEDGSAFIGQPQLKVNATFLGCTLLLAGVNKVRTATDGYYLFTEDFGTSTLNTSEGYDVILTPVTDSEVTSDGTDSASADETSTAASNDTDTDSSGDSQSTQLTIGGSVTCTVTAVRQSTDSTEIPKGSFVLSINYNSNEWLISELQSLVVGDTVVLDVSSEDSRWSQATAAVGGLFRLIENGVINSSLDSETASMAQSQAPRTAVGVKEDGTVVFYTIDGREYGYSVGATIKQVAQRLLELGCVDAISLDGGGSTSFDVTMPDGTTTTVLNSPSDGSERRVSNAVFLVSKLSATGSLGSVYVKSSQQLLLPGATAQFTASGVDTAYYPMSIGAASWSAEGGSVDSSGIFTAGSVSMDAVITASATDAAGNTASGSSTVRVITTPTAITLSDESTGLSVSSINVQVGTTLALKASALWNTLAVTGDDSCFTWSVDSTVGTVDAQGNFVAGQTAGTGNLTITVGDKTVTIPVTVERTSPFVDTDGNWAEKYIIQLYDFGVTTGVDTDAGLCYYPSKSITRGEFFLMVARWMGLDTSQYEDIDLPFADSDSIASWALSGVKAVYAEGILTGSEENGALYAKTDSVITRAEAMTILGRTLDAAETADLSSYADAADVPTWAASYVQTLVAAGIINGDDTGKLNPNANITRAEVAKILVTMTEQGE